MFYFKGPALSKLHFHYKTHIFTVYISIKILQELVIKHFKQHDSNICSHIPKCQSNQSCFSSFELFLFTTFKTFSQIQTTTNHFCTRTI